MTVLAIIIAVVLAIIAFKFIKGVIKLGLLAMIALLCIFIAHETGAI